MEANEKGPGTAPEEPKYESDAPTRVDVDELIESTPLKDMVMQPETVVMRRCWVSLRASSRQN